ncbi:amastin-like protein [Leptomonas pyrrhocoris]|uniref:Amastin-like protein n=1 Tax=Leptomonas pyrrhocoris TaxID=157538 RepID=A0A0N0VG30_LEPPY|nr:amastin-like protein [Leptomonas pyrrhocoris]KPA82144.1 amastin-like protein [Leptomonas pyrrhocoris]|eukprot:XP_015660583.1 amastin-like protein [Leptomonas pyrrhocoris]
MCNAPFRVGIVIYCILQFIAFLFLLVGTPIDQFRLGTDDMFSNSPCLTIWGWKNKCISATWSTLTNELWSNCTHRRDRFRASEGLAIAALAIALIACIFGFVMLCCCRCLRWLCFILNLLATGTGCAVSALMIDAYYNRHDSLTTGEVVIGNITCGALRENAFVKGEVGAGVAHFKYGAGFALHIVGWGLCFINIIFLMLPC